jgi:hypothetical protein
MAKKLIMTQKGLSSSVVELNTEQVEYILGLIENDLELNLYDTKRLLMLNLLYKRFLNLKNV